MEEELGFMIVGGIKNFLREKISFCGGGEESRVCLPLFMWRFPFGILL